MLEAFAAGCGGRLATTDAERLEPGAAVFYGVRPDWAHLWEQAKAEGRDWFYIDNAYFDATRETYFRVTRNLLQCDGQNAVWGDGARLARLGIKVRPWQRGGHVVVCPQSDEFMRIVGWQGDWLEQVVTALKAATTRPLVIRRKGEKRPLADDLKGAWALVTHMSCAAVEALVAGVPVFCTGRCAAQWMGMSDLASIEAPFYPERREVWAEVLANNQWTPDEMASGEAWKDLRG